MRFLKITDFVNGWLIGDFSPSLYTSKDVEVAHMRLAKGHKADGHYHKVATEYNYIVRGKALVNSRILVDGDFFIYEPGDRATVEYLEETDIMVIKLPSIKCDKFY